MKWIGAFLLIGTTTWAGFHWSTLLSNRPKHIRQLKSALQILEAEILYSQSSLKEAFEVIAKQIPLPTYEFFNSLSLNMDEKTFDFFALWQQHLKSYLNNSALSNNEAEILSQFGRTLGQHDFVQQQKHIQLATTHLDRELTEAKENQYKYAKMAKSIGLLSGLFIVILLI